MIVSCSYFYTFQRFKKLWLSAVTTWYKAKLSMKIIWPNKSHINSRH